MDCQRCDDERRRAEEPVQGARYFYLSEEDSAREYSRLVSKLVRPYFLKGGDYDDLYQEGMIGLLQAIRNYSPDRGGFEQFATVCIKSRLFDTIRSHTSIDKRQKQLIDKLQMEATPSTSVTGDPETQLLANESAKEIQTELSGLLSAFEARVLDHYLEGFTVSEIARRLDRPSKSVDNAVQRIRRKLAALLKKGDIRR